VKNKIQIIAVVIVLVLAGAVLFFHHFYLDHDFSKLLLNPKTSSLSQKQKPIPTISQLHHVFVIVEENHDWSTIYNNPAAPYINKTLLKQGSYAQNYHNVAANLDELHPSEPNYIFLESGMIAFPDHPFTTDDDPSAKNSTASHNHLSYLLEQQGLSWKSYQEDISGTDCPINTTKNYVPRHNPFVYFQDVSGNPPSTTNANCKTHMSTITQLSKDLSSEQVANYNFITPNLQHDMHNGTIAQADTWLSRIVPQITNSQTFKKDGILFITWDEGSEGVAENNPIGMIILSPYVKQGYTNNIEYSHASYVKTIEEIFQLSPLLGFASSSKTQDLSKFLINN
jgi:predicted MPP superfamily phosphohydrolase